MKSMKNSLCLIACVFCLTAMTYAQESESRNLGSFDGISVSSGIEAELVQGNSNSIDITAKGIELEKVTTEIKGDVLKVGIDQSWWKSLGKRSKRKVEVVITYSSTIESVHASSGSSIDSDDPIRSKRLELDASSGAFIDLELDVNDAVMDLSSGANMTLSGNAGKISVDMSSGSTLKAFELQSRTVHVDGSSGSTARVHASSGLSVDISSGATVRYKGDPSDRDFDRSSGASVIKA